MANYVHFYNVVEKRKTFIRLKTLVNLMLKSGRLQALFAPIKSRITVRQKNHVN